MLKTKPYEELKSLEDNNFKTFIGLIWNNKVKTIVDVLKENLKDNIYVVEYIFNFLILRDLITASDIKIISNAELESSLLLKTNRYYLNKGDFSFSIINEGMDLNLKDVFIKNKINVFCNIINIKFESVFFSHSWIKKSYLSCNFEKLIIEFSYLVENDYLNLNIIQTNFYKSNFENNYGKFLYLESVNFIHSNFKKNNFVSLDIKNSNFNKSSFESNDGNDLYLDSVNFFDSNFGLSVFSGRIENCQFENVIFKELNLIGEIFFINCNFTNCTFINCLDNQEILFKNCSVKGIDFTKVNNNLAVFENTVIYEN